MRLMVSMLATVMLALGATGVTGQEMTIKFSHVNTDNTPKGYAALKFKELAEKYLEGRVNIEVYPSGTLFGDAQEMEALLLNDVQIIAPSLSKFERYTDKLQVFDLPFLFSDADAVTRFQESDAGRELLNSIADRGFTGLGYIHNGMKQMSAHKEMRNPGVAMGLRFRIQPSRVIEEQYKAVGANPQKMAFSEVYQALQTGVVDGQENSWTSIYTMKFFEVQPYIVETNHGMMSFMVTVSTDWWEGLPDDIRDGLRRAIADAASEANAFAEGMHEENKTRIIESGRSEIVTLSEQELQAWRDAMKPVWGEFEDEIGRELIDAAQSANKGS
jgi:C4-dicarboxylate-binding protein DctP